MRPHTPEEIRRWAHMRQPAEREAVPAVSERLLFRERDFGEPVPVVVAAVQDLVAPGSHWQQHGDRVQQEGAGVPDPTVWVHDEAARQWRLHDDPWPWVQVRAIRQDEDGADVLGAPRWCKEARVRGSAGWLREGSRAHTGNYESEG